VFDCQSVRCVVRALILEREAGELLAVREFAVAEGTEPDRARAEEDDGLRLGDMTKAASRR
jgi:hypothetical protein